MPGWLLWLSPVVLVTLGAVLWTAWSGRTRGPADPARTVAEHARFRAALAGDRTAGATVPATVRTLPPGAPPERPPGPAGTTPREPWSPLR